MSYNTKQDWRDFLRKPCEDTFAPIYESTQGLVWTICFRILRSEEEAQDAFQGTWVRLMTAVRDEPHALRASDRDTVIRRLAVLEAERLRKKRSRRSRKEFAVENLPFNAASEAASPPDICAAEELRLRMETLVETLPDPYRLPVLLHYFHNLTHQQIGEMLGKPTSTISTQISRGVKKLKPMAKRAGLGEAAVLLGAIALSGGMLTPPAAVAAPASQVYSSASASAAFSPASAGLAPSAFANFVTSCRNGLQTLASNTVSAAFVLAAMSAPVVIVIVIVLASANKEPEVSSDPGPISANTVDFEPHEAPLEQPSAGDDKVSIFPAFDRTNEDTVRESIGDRAGALLKGEEHEFRDQEITEQLDQ